MKKKMTIKWRNMLYVVNGGGRFGRIYLFNELSMELELIDEKCFLIKAPFFSASVVALVERENTKIWQISSSASLYMLIKRYCVRNTSQYDLKILLGEA